MNPAVLIILGGLLLAGYFWIRQLPAHKRTAAMIKMVLLLLTVILVVLTITGRIHWIGAVFASLFFLLKKYQFLFRFIPLLGKLFKHTQPTGEHQQGSAHRPNGSHTMSRTEALKILGLNEGCSEEEVIQAHRRLMQKVHPDHGGNAYLAAQLNEARSLLLKK